MTNVLTLGLDRDEQDHDRRGGDRGADVDDLRKRARRLNLGGAALQPFHLRRIRLLTPDVAETVEVEVSHSFRSSIDLSAVLARDSLSAKAFGAISSISEISG